MSLLFGSSASQTAATNTVGDLKQDVQLNNPPEDSISDLAFNPNPADQKDFLAVASWDKKVRIYEIHNNGQGEGKHLYEHDGPVFACDYFKVCLLPDSTPTTEGGIYRRGPLFSLIVQNNKTGRTEDRFRRRGQTGQGM